MRTTSSIQFYCRKCKTDRNGYAPLECSITLSGQRKFLNLPIKFKPYGKRPPVEVLEAMDLWRNRITQYQVDMMRENMVITAETLREVIQQGGVRTYTVGRLFNDYLYLLRKRVGIDLKDTVYRKYELVAEKALKYVSRDADISKITPHLIQTIIGDWRGLYDASTLCGYATRLKTFIRYGMDNGHITVNPFQGIRLSKPVKPIKYLTEDEVMNLLALSLEPRLQRVLDLFLIQCGTGMAYADICNFTLDDLRQVGEYHYISKNRVKSGKNFTAIVFPWAVPIIKPYKTLPVISNQVYNRYLKEINSSLTSHMGRRTYATLLYNKKVSMDAVAAALGDNPQIAARYYAKVFDSTILTEQMTAFK